MCRCYGKSVISNFCFIILACTLGSCKSGSMISHLVNTEIPYQGKTLTMIALILATKADKDLGFSKSTLIGGITFVIFFRRRLLKVF